MSGARMRTALALAVAAAALAGCSGAGAGGDTVSGDVLRIYSSQPLRGTLAAQARAIVRGERLALADARGRAGKWRVQLRALNDADPVSGIWEPGLVSASARRAAQDDKTIAYLGETDTGASAVSIPILNETGLLALSPTDSVTGFTREAGANPGEPDKYYPTRDENFARLVPPDDVQSAALLGLMGDERVEKVFVLHDQRLYGQGIARAVGRGARRQGVAVVKVEGTELDDETDLPALAAEVAASGADGFLYAGEPGPQVAGLYDAVAAAVPRARLLGTYTQANDAFARALAPRLTVLATAPWLSLGSYPPAARRLAARYERRYGEPMPTVALYGYEAMAVVLDAIRRARGDGNDRATLIDEVRDTRNRASVLGTYSFDRNGDVGTKVYGAWRVRAGRVAFVRVLDPLGA
ncbi:MAG TPA: branched-chain amino acid ABC transporter substrate-binding protein [Solirubrobacteraceae bacterium]|nr:branched-chain amino acid ABC transporter substrate-binding protein [Solirubrobacteraceae bacterium]